jgi:hypothetical protein
VDSRSASDNLGEPWGSSVQLSHPFQPGTTGHGHEPIRSRTEEASSAALEALRVTGQLSETEGFWNSRRSPLPWAAEAFRLVSEIHVPQPPLSEGSATSLAGSPMCSAIIGPSGRQKASTVWATLPYQGVGRRLLPARPYR